MRKDRFTFVRLVAMLALAFAFVGALATPAAAQNIVSGPCQVTDAGAEIPIVQDDCQFAVDQASQTCSITAGGETVQFVDGCALLLQGECPTQLIESADGAIIQIICDEDDEFATSTPDVTPTDVPPTATDVPATATDVPATATDVPPTATPDDDVTPTPDDDVTPTPDDDVTPTPDDDVTPVPDDDDDRDDDDKDRDDDDRDVDDDKEVDDVVEDDDVVADDDEVVAELPSTGQGPGNGQSDGMLVLLFGAMSALLAAAGFAWQRRSIA